MPYDGTHMVAPLDARVSRHSSVTIRYDLHYACGCFGAVAVGWDHYYAR